MTAEETGFLRAIKQNPADATARGAYADWLDEHDRSYEAALQRSKAGLSEVFFKLRRKSDGLFSTAQRPNARAPMRWDTKGKMWRKIDDLHSHMRGLTSTRTSYAGTPWSDLEVVVLEVRVTYTTTLPVAEQKHPRWENSTQITVVEPLGAGAEGEA
jgi:uncharacterized protein (TIGR02996 family)